MTEFDRKPWNYGAGGSSEVHGQNSTWSECNSVCSRPGSAMERSFCLEDQQRKRLKERRRSLQIPRKISITEFEKKPWNYGAGGSEHLFGKKKRNSVVEMDNEI